MTATNEQVQFRFIVMECCQHQLCWVNPRLPSYCPACGRMCYPVVRNWILMLDSNATLRIAPQMIAQQPTGGEETRNGKAK